MELFAGPPMTQILIKLSLNAHFANMCKNKNLMPVNIEAKKQQQQHLAKARDRRFIQAEERPSIKGTLKY
uniref:Uncharacterized protein n=1 Tax=Xenopus tropicalis TaxID=8364 RepID=A0A6I8R5X4_XENTR